MSALNHNLASEALRRLETSDFLLWDWTGLKKDPFWFQIRKEKGPFLVSDSVLSSTISRYLGHSNFGHPVLTKKRPSSSGIDFLGKYRVTNVGVSQFVCN